MIRRITPEQAGQRLDTLLAELAGVSRSRAQTLIERGSVLINDVVPAKNGVPVQAGDVLFFEVPEPVPAKAVAQTLALDIVYEDADLIVLNKARGMVVHPAAGHADGTLVNALLAHCGDLSGIGGELRPGIVHRLDMDTTGLMVVAKNDRAHIGLSAQIKQKNAGRLYTAAVYGSVKHADFIIDKPIGRHKADRKKMAVSESGRSAQTRVQLWEPLKSAALLGMALQTGRTHQIRVHLQSLGHPVLGDPIYGHAAAQKNAPVLMLHAYGLSFAHPVTEENLRFLAPPPEDFLDVLRALGWSGQIYWSM